MPITTIETDGRPVQYFDPEKMDWTKADTKVKAKQLTEDSSIAEVLPLFNDSEKELVAAVNEVLLARAQAEAGKPPAGCISLKAMSALYKAFKNLPQWKNVPANQGRRELPKTWDKATLAVFAAQMSNIGGDVEDDE